MEQGQTRRRGRNPATNLTSRWEANRWLRRIYRDLKAEYQESLRPTFCALATGAIPVEGISVAAVQPRFCVAELNFANGSKLQLTRCHTKTIMILEEGVTSSGATLERACNHGAFWSLDFNIDGHALAVLTSHLAFLELP